MADSILLSETTTINDAGALITALANNDSFILSQQDGTTRTIDAIELVKEIGRIAGLNTGAVNLAPLVNGLIPSQYVSHGGGTGTTFHLSGDAAPANTSGAVGDLWLSTSTYDLFRLTSVSGEGATATYTWTKQGNIRGTQVRVQNSDPSNTTAGIVGDIIFNLGTGEVFELASINGANYDWDSKGTLHQDTAPVQSHDLDDAIISDQLQNGYYFPPARSGRLISGAGINEHLYQFGSSSFSVTMVVDFSNDLPTDREDTIFSTIRNTGTGIYSKGVRLVIGTDGKLYFYFNDVANRGISAMTKSLGSRESIAGKSALITIAVDRASRNLRIYINNDLQINQSIDPALGDLDGAGIYLGHMHVQQGDNLHDRSFPLGDCTIHNLVIWNRVLAIADIKQLVRSKNYPKPTDQYADEGSYDSDFSSNADGWIGVNSTTARLASSDFGNVLQIKVGTILSSRKTGYKPDVFEPNSVYEVSFLAGKSTDGVNNDRANGFNVYCGGIIEEQPIGTEHDPAIGNRVLESGVIANTAGSPLKPYKALFRSTTDEDTNDALELRIILTRNGSEVFADSGQNDSFEFKDFKVRKIGAVEHWSASSPTRLQWTPDYDESNVITNEGAYVYIKRTGNKIIIPEANIILRTGTVTPTFSYARREMVLQVNERLVHLTGRITLNSTPTAANLQSLQLNIQGIPLAASDHGDVILNVLARRITSTLRGNDVTATIPSGSDTIWLHKIDQSGFSHLTLGNVERQFDLFFSGTYTIP